jgi:hypothetical protein
MRPSLSLACPLLAICVFIGPILLGCGGSGVRLGAVSGAVIYKGKPVTEGTVLFQPELGPGASGALDARGHYVLRTKSRSDGAPLGNNTVVIIPPTDLTGPESPTPGMLPKRDYPNIPKKFRRPETSGLVRDVKPGNNVFDFELGD